MVCGSHQNRLEQLKAEKYGERYWVYVVENVHSDGSVTEIQNPHEALASLIIRETNMVDTYTAWNMFVNNLVIDHA